MLIFGFPGEAVCGFRDFPALERHDPAVAELLAKTHHANVTFTGNDASRVQAWVCVAVLD